MRLRTTSDRRRCSPASPCSAAACGDDDPPAATDRGCRHRCPPPAPRRRRLARTRRPAPTRRTPRRRQRIVSLAPTHTEMLFAIGAGEQVIAVDDQSNYPPEAEAVRTDLSGFEPNVEAIAGYEPDLVVHVRGHTDSSTQLEDLGIAVWVGRGGDDVRRHLRPDRAARRGHRARRRGGRGRRPDARPTSRRSPPSVPAGETPLTVLPRARPDTLFSANSSTFIGQVYSQLGLRNIADQAEGDTRLPAAQRRVDHRRRPRPDLPRRHQVLRREPRDRRGPGDGWADIAAVANGNVFAMDDDIASRWGPRVVEYMQTGR